MPPTSPPKKLEDEFKGGTDWESTKTCLSFQEMETTKTNRLLQRTFTVSYLAQMARISSCQTFCGRSRVSALRSSHKHTAWSPVIKENALLPTWSMLSFWLRSCTPLYHQDPWCCESINIHFCAVERLCVNTHMCTRSKNSYHSKG